MRAGAGAAGVSEATGQRDGPGPLIGRDGPGPPLIGRGHPAHAGPHPAVHVQRLGQVSREGRPQFCNNNAPLISFINTVPAHLKQNSAFVLTFLFLFRMCKLFR